VARPKKQQHFKLLPFVNDSGSQSWRISGTMPDGRRVRRNFQDKPDALRELHDLELEIEQTPEPRQALRTLLTVEQLADAESAFQQIDVGTKLSTSIAHYTNLRRRAGEMGADLDQAIAFFESRYRPETESITILNAKSGFLSNRVGIAPETRTNYDRALSLLLRPDPNKFVHLFTVSDIESVLGAYKNIRSKRSFSTIFSMFFSWAVRHHYCLENPCGRLDKLPTEMSPIVALSLEESMRLLGAAMLLQDGAAAAPVAIAMFAGLRPSEIRDLKPNDILKDKIRVSGGKMRRKLKRSVPIPSVLGAWLKEYPFKGLPKGWDYKMKAIKKATKAEEWVPDILRHTSITFQTERDRDEARTAFNNGTSIEMMNRHYRDSIDSCAVVEKFWSMTPAKIRRAKLDIEMPSVKKVDWPTKSVLKKLVWQKPLVHAATELGVSNVAVKKRCVKLGIELPPPGHWLR
jgi:integrase